MKANITRKQAGVIYRNYKEGNITATEQQISELYNKWTENFVMQTTDSHVADVVDRFCACIDAIFAGDLETAQHEFDGAFNAISIYWTAA